MPESLVIAVWRVSRIFPIIIGVLLAINGIVFAIISTSIAPDLRALEHRWSDSQARSRGNNSVEGKMEALEVLFRKGEADLAQFRNAVPGKETFTTFLGELFSLAAKAGLSIDRVSYAPKDEAELALLRYTLSFSVQGDYGQIKKFIHSIEQSSRPTIIEGITLSGAEAGRGEGVSLALRLSTFFRADKS
jgi:type IV pilus assembly protein PilO